jgi:putative endonuclease
MYTIYALVYKNQNRIYIGMTSDLGKRVDYHKRGKTRSTKNRGGFEVKIVEKWETREDARKREKYWKSGYGKERLKSKYRGVEQSGSSRGS